jgi:hypothetical protein
MEPEVSYPSLQEPAILSQINHLHITVFVMCCMFEFYGRPQTSGKVTHYLTGCIEQVPS